MYTSPTPQGSAHQFENNPRLPAPPQNPLTGRSFRGIVQLWQCVNPPLCETRLRLPHRGALCIAHITQGEDEATSYRVRPAPARVRQAGGGLSAHLR